MKRVLHIVSAPWRWLQALWRLITAPWRWLHGRWQAVRRFFTDEPEEVSLTDTLGDSLADREAFWGLLQGFGEHLEALRAHLLRSVVVLALATAVCAWRAEWIMAALAVPLTEDGPGQLLALTQRPPAKAWQSFIALGQAGLSKLQVIEPTESVGVFMRVSLLFGTALAMPWMVLEIFLFIAPGLFPRSRILLLLSLPAISLLFVAGLLFTYLIMLPTAVPFLENFMGFRAAWRPAAYFNLVTGLMFWVGVAFQMPLVIYALASVGLLKARQLLEQWRIAIVVIAIIAAAITPTTDPVNMGLVMLPMSLLYFFSIAAAWVAERGLKGRRPQSA
jgi:sec-independent protein translocase protein TatC